MKQQTIQLSYLYLGWLKSKQIRENQNTNQSLLISQPKHKGTVSHPGASSQHVLYPIAGDWFKKKTHFQRKCKKQQQFLLPSLFRTFWHYRSLCFTERHHSTQETEPYKKKNQTLIEREKKSLALLCKPLISVQRQRQRQRQAELCKFEVNLEWLDIQDNIVTRCLSKQNKKQKPWMKDGTKRK